MLDAGGGNRPKKKNVDCIAINKIPLQETVKKLYLEGYDCTESILHSLKEENVINIPDEILRTVTGFRVGIAGSGCICGVVTGGVIAIGLKYVRINKKENKE